MCGIAGALALHDKAESQVEDVSNMLSLLKHRGDQPLSLGSIGNGTVGCCRLAIVDRERNAQPSFAADGRIAVVFNGEIYNFKALRDELISKGVDFFSEGDTEVIANGYLVWGQQLFDRLDGMFAIAVLDKRSCKTSLTLARDPFGIKPLYYSISNETIRFASEMLPLKHYGAELIRPVMPGHMLVDGKQIAHYVVHDPQVVQDSSPVESLRARLSAAVRKRVQTDLEFGILCSGGVDSAILLLESLRNCTDVNQIHVFTVGTQDAIDVRFARKTVEFLASRFDPDLNKRFHVVNITQDGMVGLVSSTVQAIESFEPNHIRAGTANLYLASKIKELGIKIVLCGEGADELFGGYHEFGETFFDSGADAASELVSEFFFDLHRTQLQRVDRTHMRYGIEARVPFMDRSFAEFSLSLPISLKIEGSKNSFVSKAILRKAYQGDLPDEIVWRRKVPLGEGAGIGDNRSEGPFHDFVHRVCDPSLLKKMQAEQPAWQLRNLEDCYYAEILREYLGSVEMWPIRPRTNVKATR
jgi:asparagine synthase (glutamine-hydrolysing)